METFFHFAWQHLPALLKGTEATLVIWIISVTFGFFFGWCLALARAYCKWVGRVLATGYIELFRGTPMLVQMFIIYMGLPSLGIVLSPITAAIVAIGLNTAAYQAEYFRAGIGSIPSGQMVAARSIGMSRSQAIRNILIPQAMRIALPQWSNEIILELKYTSIAFAIGVQELMGQAKLIGSNTFDYFQIFVVAAVIYVVLVSAITTVLGQLEKQYALRQ